MSGIATVGLAVVGQTVVGQTTGGAAPAGNRFITPGRQMSMDPTGRDSLWSRVMYTQGDAVIKYLDGTFKQVTIWDPDEQGVDKVYLGGYVHMVTDEEAAALTLAGYGANITVTG